MGRLSDTELDALDYLADGLRSSAATCHIERRTKQENAATRRMLQRLSMRSARHATSRGSGAIRPDTPSQCPTSSFVMVAVDGSCLTRAARTMSCVLPRRSSIRTKSGWTGAVMRLVGRAWCPEHGDTVELSIGYKGLPLVPCGEFQIDEPNARLGRGGDSFSFRAVSAPVTKAIRSQNSKRFEKQTLKQVAEKIAKEHGFQIVGEPPEVYFEHIAQRRERDLEFLSRMSDDFGIYFSVKGNKLVFAKREELHERDPVFLIRSESDDYISADLKRSSHKTYSKAKATYFEGNEKKKIEVEIEDKKVKNGDTLRIDDRVENVGQAQALAKSRLEKENLKKQTGNLIMVGNPLLLAGNKIELDEGFGRWAGEYLIKTSRHHIVRGQGYTTNIEINAVGGTGGDEKPKGTKTKPKTGPAGEKRTSAPGIGKSVGANGFALPAARA